MAGDKQQNSPIPLVEESLVVDKRVVETGRVRVRTVVDQELAHLQDDLRREQVLVDRVDIDRDVETAPQIRREGDLLIIPVVEEYLHVEKRLRLKEELHVRLVERVEPVSEHIPVRRMRAVVERQGPGGDPSPPNRRRQ